MKRQLLLFVLVGLFTSAHADPHMQLPGLPDDPAIAQLVEQGMLFADRIENNPLFNNPVNRAWNRYGDELALFGSPLLELGEIMSVTSTKPGVQAAGAAAGQLSAMTGFRKYYGPHSFYNALYRIPERIRRLSRARYLTKAVAGLSKKERRKLLKERKRMVKSLIATTIMKLIVGYDHQLLARLAGDNVQAHGAIGILNSGLMLASMITSWKRHNRMRRVMHRLMKKVHTRKQEDRDEAREEDDELAALEAEFDDESGDADEAHEHAST